MVKNMNPLVVAIGGNALIKRGQEGTIYEQFANARETCSHIVRLIKMGYDLVLTHGNGPQVGNELLRHEHAREMIPPYPLGMCVAETIGGMGYMLQQTMQNTLKHEGIDKTAVMILTQVLVEEDDPAFKNPTKPIGKFFIKEEIDRVMELEHETWDVAEDSAGRGWRRVVPSPYPKAIIEKQQIERMLKAGIIVIACGGGGLPVVWLPNGDLDGREAVVDKDYASSRLATVLGCKKFMILTEVDKVYLNYKKEDQQPIDQMTMDEAKKHMEDGQFPRGSMRPKIQAGINFLERGGKEVIITDIHLAEKAILGETGTRIVH
jgi:carbamate kinase